MIEQPQTGNIHQQEDPPFTFRELGSVTWKKIQYSFRLWRLIFILLTTGMLLGLVYSLVNPVTYTARLSFVVEDSKASGGSLVSALAGQFGFDMSNLTGGGGVLAGDNVLELLKSRSFIKKTLLTPYQDTGNTSLADEYATIYHWKTKWLKNKVIGKTITFPAGKIKFSRLEDSLLQIITKRITDQELSVIKPDKKLSIFEIETTMRDEKLSQLFCERLLQITTDFYIDTKTRRLQRNVERLQKRTDSIGQLLNRQTYISSSESKLLLDINPAYTTSTVNSEISNRDKIMLSTIYAELVKNLELSKTALIQETPTVQVVDQPELPLKINRVRWYKGMIIGGIAAYMLFIGWILFFKKSPDSI